jgi:protoporphyrinogen oxidase
MKTLILGAGLTGLSVASRLKGDYEIIEKEAVCGGLCRSHLLKGFTFDTAGHVLHFKDKKNLAFCRRLLGVPLTAHQRDSRVWVHPDFIPYPFQHHFLSLDAKAAQECLRGFKKAQQNPVCACDRSVLNYKTWILRTFGPGIARQFMFPYNEKFWGHPLEKMSAHGVMSRIPVPVCEEFGAARRPAGYNARFWYPRSGGIQALVRALEKRVKKVRTSWVPVRLDLASKEAFFQNGLKMRFDNVVSTIPLPELGAIIMSLPRDVKKAFSRLKYISVLNLNLGIRGSLDTRAHWIYFPQKDIIFYRLGIPTNFLETLAPPAASTLTFEVSYSARNPVDKKQILGRILADCKKCGLFIRREDILVQDIQDITYGYCLYDLETEKSLEIVRDYLRAHDVFGAGRFGAWRYASIEDCVVEAAEVARKINGRRN